MLQLLEQDKIKEQVIQETANHFNQSKSNIKSLWKKKIPVKYKNPGRKSELV